MSPPPKTSRGKAKPQVQAEGQPGERVSKPPAGSPDERIPPEIRSGKAKDAGKAQGRPEQTVPPHIGRGKAKPVAAKNERLFTDIPGFDKLLGNGIPPGSSVLVEGGPGSGKTIFCLSASYHFCESGKHVLYMSFEEPEDHLVHHMESFGWPAKKYMENGLLRIKRFNALDVARSVEALLSEAKKELLIAVDPVFFPRDFKPDVVFIDSLTSISSAFSGEESRFRVYMEQLFRYLERENISSFLIREVANPTHTGSAYVEEGEAVSFLSDGIIIIYNVLYPNGERGTAVEILKMRGTPIVKKIVRMDITKEGLFVYPDQQVPANCTLT